MNKNKKLEKAKNEKNDEFYTQYVDVEKEMIHYVEHFKDKIIYCNCDDENSNFFKYLSDNFKLFGLKKLIASCFKREEVSYKLERSDENDIIKTHLLGDGDFRSNECIELLKEADIIITNPPFSLFREYVAQLVEYDKRFIILGHQNAITYKDIFKLIKADKIWLGQSIHNGNREFRISKDYPLNSSNNRVDDEGNKFTKVSGVTWYTNLYFKNQYKDLILHKNYNEEEYPKYENFDAINIDKVLDIPIDYVGYMGVPITFLNKYNPGQFEIIGLGVSNLGIEIGIQPYKAEHKKYRKEIQKCGVADGDLYMMKDGIVKKPYVRILIKKKREK